MTAAKSSTTEEPATIVIAGGGIVGLVLAMAIKKQLGVVAEIYEKTATFAGEVGAGLGMYPNGLRVLRDISPQLLADVRSAGYPYMYRRWEHYDGSEIMSTEESILSQGEKDLDSIGIRRSRLQQVLLEHASSQGITIHFSKGTASAENRDDGLVQVHFADGTSRLTRVLFGADGGKSKVRSVVCGANEPALAYTGITCLMGIAKCTPEEKGIRFPSSNKRDFHAVFFPTGEKEQCFQFHFPIEEKDANQLNWGNLSESVGKSECRKLAKQLRAEGWHERYLAPLLNVTHAVRVGFALLEPRLTTWVKGHIALVGDAAHPPVPYVGQGAQQGMEDVGVVVTLLRMYCLDENGQFDTTQFEKAMTIYQDIRIKRSSEILDFSKSLGSMEEHRSGDSPEARNLEVLLRGEVLMYGTLQVLVPGADHDYKDDVKDATTEKRRSSVSKAEAQAALESMLGLDQVCSFESSSNKVSPEDAYEAMMLLMGGY